MAINDLLNGHGQEKLPGGRLRHGKRLPRFGGRHQVAVPGGGHRHEAEDQVQAERAAPAGPKNGTLQDSPAAFYALWDRVFHTAPAMGMAVALLAASVGGLRRRVLPRWTWPVALATSALLLVDITEDLATTGTNLGPLGLVAVGLATVWIVGVCVAAWRQPAAVTSAEG